MSSDYKKLRAEWDKRLKESGFVDIEQADGNLKAWHSYRFRPGSHVISKPGQRRAASDVSLNGAAGDVKSRQDKADYYYHAYQFLCNHEFKTERDKHVWEQHTEGYGYSEIPARLKAKGVKVGRSTAQKTVKYYKKLMLAGIEET